MNMRDLIPWSRGNPQAPAYYRDTESPVLALHREMNRLFDDVFRSFDTPFGSMSWQATWPKIEVSDTDKELRVAAEVPGVEEKDIELLLDDGALVLRGETKSESESGDGGRQFSERFVGRFERRIPLPADVEEDKVNADFKNGLLTVCLPKSAQAQAKAKRIAINGRR